MSQEPFEPFRKIFEAPLQDDDIARIAAALFDGGGAALAAEAADLLHRFSVLIEITKTVAESDSLDELLPRLIDVITDVLHADRMVPCGRSNEVSSAEVPVLVVEKANWHDNKSAFMTISFWFKLSKY